MEGYFLEEIRKATIDDGGCKGETIRREDGLGDPQGGGSENTVERIRSSQG